MLIKILSYRRTLEKSTKDEKKTGKKSVFSQYNLRIVEQTTSHEIVTNFFVRLSLIIILCLETIAHCQLDFSLDAIQKLLLYTFNVQSLSTTSNH